MDSSLEEVEMTPDLTAFAHAVRRIGPVSFRLFLSLHPLFYFEKASLAGCTDGFDPSVESSSDIFHKEGQVFISEATTDRLDPSL